MRYIAGAITAVFLLLAQAPVSLFTASSAAEHPRGAISGRVVLEYGQPHPNASVYLYSANRSSGAARRLSTDDEGRFRADGLSAGSYTIQVHAPGYVLPSEPTARRRYRLGDSVTLTLIKGGVITGAVTTPTGEPVVGIAVQAIRARDQEGRPLTSLNLAGERLTDDRGVYRMYGLQPGSYKVRAGGLNSVTSQGCMKTKPQRSILDIRYRGEKGRVISGRVLGLIPSSSLPRGVAVQLLDAKTGLIESFYPVQAQDNDRGSL